jgi:hypothetical protein
MEGALIDVALYLVRMRALGLNTVPILTLVVDDLCVDVLLLAFGLQHLDGLVLAVLKALEGFETVLDLLTGKVAQELLLFFFFGKGVDVNFLLGAAYLLAHFFKHVLTELLALGEILQPDFLAQVIALHPPLLERLLLARRHLLHRLPEVEVTPILWPSLCLLVCHHDVVAFNWWWRRSHQSLCGIVSKVVVVPNLGSLSILKELFAF